MTVWIKPAIAKVWKVVPEEKRTRVQLSTSEKQNDGTWKNSNWFTAFVGKAHNKAARDLNEGDKIRILSGKIEIVSKQKPDGKYENYTNMAVFDYEEYVYDPDAEKENSGSQKKSNKPAPKKKDNPPKVKTEEEDEDYGDYDADNIPF